jgi:hypothetical protein
MTELCTAKRNEIERPLEPPEEQEGEENNVEFVEAREDAAKALNFALIVEALR